MMLQPADTITFGEVLRIFEGPLAPLPCLSRNAHRCCEDCEDEASRLVLVSRTIADALRESGTTRA